MDQHSAIHVDGGTGDVGGKIGGEKQEGSGDVVGHAKAVERHAPRDFLLHLRGQLAARDVGLDQAGGHAIRPDSINAEFPCHILGKTKHPGLGSRIVRATKDAAAPLRRDGRREHDRALLAFPHMGNEGLAEIENATQIHIQNRVVIGGFDFEEFQRLADAGVVDKNIDLSEVGDDLCGHLVALVEIDDIADIAAMLRADAVRHFARLGAFEIEDDNAGTVLREELGSGEADAPGTGGARNDGDLIREQHPIFLPAVVRLREPCLIYPLTNKREVCTQG